MPADAGDLTGVRVALALAEAGLASVCGETAAKLAQYGNLLLRWNARTNLTAIRTTEGVLQRHLVECIAAAQALPAEVRTLLDFGSGAGLPGIPIALVRPEIRVTLAESQLKKVAFLREATRTVAPGAVTLAGRVEDTTASMRFNCVTMRAVDRMKEALAVGRSRVSDGGWLGLFSTTGADVALLSSASPIRTTLPTVGEFVLYQL